MRNFMPRSQRRIQEFFKGGAQCRIFPIIRWTATIKDTFPFRTKLTTRGGGANRKMFRPAVNPPSRQLAPTPITWSTFTKLSFFIVSKSQHGHHHLLCLPSRLFSTQDVAYVTIRHHFFSFLTYQKIFYVSLRGAQGPPPLDPSLLTPTLIRIAT